MKSAAIIGGSNGIGLSIVMSLEGYDCLYIIDRQAPSIECWDILHEMNPATRIEYIPFDLLTDDYGMFDRLTDIDSLIITAGFGRLALFGSTREDEINRSFQVNAIGPMRIIRHFYDRISDNSKDFYCAVMVSISGIVSSPFFSIYSATKAALHRFIESVNVELEKSGAKNRILEISPGSIKGTAFNGGRNDVSQTLPLAGEIIERMYRRELVFIPQYEEIFKGVITRYRQDPHQFGLESYDYKVNSGRIK